MPTKPSKKPAKVQEPDEDEEEIIEQDEEEEDAEDAEDGDSEDADTPKPPRRPKVIWDEKGKMAARLVQTMRRIASGDLEGALTPAIVREYLADDPLFAEQAANLTNARVASMAKKIREKFKKVEIPEFSVTRSKKFTEEDLLAALEEEDEE